MSDGADARHLGGGAKGLFLLLRYVFLASASYLLLFQMERRIVEPVQALAIALALASNLLLSLVPARVLFAWWVGAPLLIADTVWVAWALRAAGGIGADFFVLYLFVLLLAAVGENLLLVVLAATIASAANIYAGWRDPLWTSPVLLRVVFLFVAALFYGHVIGRIKGERSRADRGAEWIRVLEATVAERTAELRGLYEAARAASCAKTDFLASTSHELRTPLHIVIGYADMLLDGGAATAAEGAVLGGHIRRAAAGLLHLVDGVLELGRLESGNVRVDPCPVDVPAFARALEQHEWIDPQPGVTMRWDVVATSVAVLTDPPKLQIVLGNLITNALKYTRDGEVVIIVRDRPAAGAVEFVVRDTGPGIAAEQLARMREPFHESSGASGHKLAGIGLGMAIVYRYAALLGAEVAVDSVIGRGTSFTVTVPYMFAHAERAA